MTAITFDVAQFRLAFPAFASAVTYPSPVLAAYWDAATCYISDSDWGYLRGDCRRQALNLLTAHLTQTGYAAAAGQSQGTVITSTVDKITVTLLAPPVRNGWQFWLTSSPYGVRLWALLTVRSVGGFMVGGSNERGAFRKAGGNF